MAVGAFAACFIELRRRLCITLRYHLHCMQGGIAFQGCAEPCLPVPAAWFFPMDHHLGQAIGGHIVLMARCMAGCTWHITTAGVMSNHCHKT